MVDPRPVKREMLVGIVDLRLQVTDLDFDTARKAADGRAQEILTIPMLVAWFDGPAWKHSPAIC